MPSSRPPPRRGTSQPFLVRSNISTVPRAGTGKNIQIGAAASARLERLRADANDPDKLAWVSSIYPNGAMHAVRDAHPEIWQEKWMHASLCGMSTPRGGWQPGRPEQARCPMCAQMLMAAGVKATQVLVRVAAAPPPAPATGQDAGRANPATDQANHALTAISHGPYNPGLRQPNGPRTAVREKGGGREVTTRSMVKTDNPYVGEIFRSTSRQTGALVVMIDASKEGSGYNAEDGGRWVAVCTSHGQVKQYPSRREGFKGFSAVEWCSECDKIRAGNAPRAGYEETEGEGAPEAAAAPKTRSRRASAQSAETAAVIAANGGDGAGQTEVTPVPQATADAPVDATVDAESVPV